MVKQVRYKNIVYPVLVAVLYMFFFQLFTKILWENHLLVGLQKINEANLLFKFTTDFIANGFIVFLLVATFYLTKRPLKELGLTIESKKIVFLLAAVYVAMFIYYGNYTEKGIYIAFFYLVIVAFSEEIIFRGYFFSELRKTQSFLFSAVFSGLFFGVMHAFLPTITSNGTTADFIQLALSSLGQGIVGSCFFAFLYEKSRSIFVPVLVHAILDYGSLLING
ncbi:hypothetical protein RV11_GL003362 [Enterococcus phoeniculicola]|nr:hypothetical protein RV11_GL003362 [Enterococcus phoeniculicola]